jgi:hypothetical protein
MRYEKNSGLLFSYGDGRCDGARSTLNSPSTSIGDYQTNDLDPPATSLNGLAAWSCKPSLHKASDHVAIEPMHERKLVLGHAV